MNKNEIPSSDCKIALILSVGFLLLLVFIGTASAKTITVDGSGGGDYRTIQAAVDAAEDGDTIKVAVGTYHENVKIGIIGKTRDKSGCRVERKHLYIVGEDKKNTIINAGGTGAGIEIDHLRVKIDGFTIQNGKYGIDVSSGEAHKITNNIISNNKYGIYCDSGKYSIISHNTISNNERYGIYFEAGGSRKITNNIITNNFNGIRIYHSSFNTISSNTISDNDDGIVLVGYSRGVSEIIYSDDNKISDNTISNNNNNGIDLTLAPSNYIVDNKIENNKRGINLEQDSNDNTIEKNKIISNTDGIRLSSTCDDNIIEDNEILNTRYDIIVNSDYNFITNNTACEIENNGRGNDIYGNECPNRTPTPSPTPTSTSARTPEPTPTPAFEAVFAIAGLLAVVYRLRRRE